MCVLRIRVTKTFKNRIFSASKKKGRGYLRFPKSFLPSLSVTYWKPFSVSFASSSMVATGLNVSVGGEM